MRFLLSGLVAAFLLSGVMRAGASIGDTETDLVARFGVVQTRTPQRTIEHGRVHVLGERLVFEPQEWRIIAVLIEDRCARISYAKTGAWTKLEFAELLGINSGRWTWSEITGGAPKWRRTWLRSDGLVAKWTYAGGFVIEAQPFVDALARAQAAAQWEAEKSASR